MTSVQAVATLTLLLALTVTVTSHDLSAKLPLLGSLAHNPTAPAPASLAMGGLFRRLPTPGANHLGNSLLRGMKSTIPHSGQMLRRGADKFALQANSFRVELKAVGSKTITMARTLPRAWTTLMKTHPVKVCGTLEGMRYLAGDIIAQRIEARRDKSGGSNELNLQRLAVLAFWGVYYGAGLGYWSYHELYPKMFGVAGTMAALKTTVFDLGLTCPFVYYPMWHFFKAATDPWVEGTSGAAKAGGKEVSVGERAKEVCSTAWVNYKTTFVSDAVSMFAVWAPLHMINFRFVPLHQRFPFIAVTGIIWTTTFSYLQFGLE